MRASCNLLSFVVITSLCLGDPNEDEERFLAVPSAVWTSRVTEEQKFYESDLPDNLAKYIGDDFKARPDELRKHAVGFAVDLNGDGVKEYLIETVGGGTGGPMYAIYWKSKNGWANTGGYQGGISAVKGKGAWLELIFISRGGGGTFTKTHLEFRKGEYVKTFSEHYERGKITKRFPAKK